MRTLFRAATGLSVVMMVASCSGLLKKAEKDAGETTDAAPVVDQGDAAAPAPAPTASAAALATNEGDVARFPDETAIANESATLLRSYNVREAPPAGPVVAGLSKGTPVTKIASRDKYFLILFDNAKSPGTKEMGWVHKDAFSAVLQDAGPLVCPTGEIALFGDTPFCGKLCSSDRDCPTQQACKGQANKLLANGRAGDGVTVCTVFRSGPTPPTPPTPPVVDAGHPMVVDAGHPAPPAPPGPAGAADVIPASGTSCAAGYVFVKKTGKCHRPCPAGPLGHECRNTPNYCIKCDADNKKVCADSRSQCQ